MATIRKITHVRRADGQVERLPRPVWQVRFYDPDGIRRGPTFATERDAKDFAAETQTDIRRGGYIDPKAGDITLDDLADDFVDGMSGISETTRPNVFSQLTRIRDTFGDSRINRIRTADVRRWVADMEREGLSASWIRKSYRLLVRILDQAVTDSPRRLLTNPAAGVTLPKLPDVERLFLTEAQVERLAGELEARWPGYGETWCLTAAYAGARFGELAALRADDVVPGGLRIDESAGAGERGQLVYGPTKNRRRRTIRIPAFVAEGLARILAVDGASDRLVFLTRRGRALRYAPFRRNYWDPAAEAAELPEGATPHALRHTCAAILIAEGWHPKAVQAQLGHSTIRITMDTYGHLFPDPEDSAMERLAARRRATQAALEDGKVVSIRGRR